MSKTLHELGYAPRVAWYRSGKWRARAILLLGAIVLAGTVYGGWDSFCTVDDYWQCRRFSVSKDTVAMECAPGKVSQLLADPRYASGLSGGAILSGKVASLRVAPWERFAARRRSDWRGWMPVARPPILFMGVMRTDRGNSRLVVVTTDGWLATGNLYGLQLTTLSVLPVRPFGSVEIGGAQQIFSTGSLHEALLPPQLLRIHFGRVDSNDPSHLILDVETKSGKLQLHGHLREQGMHRENVLEFDDASDTSFDQSRKQGAG